MLEAEVSSSAAQEDPEVVSAKVMPNVEGRRGEPFRHSILLCAFVVLVIAIVSGIGAAVGALVGAGDGAAVGGPTYTISQGAADTLW